MNKFSFNKGVTVALGVLLLLTSCGDTDLFDTDKWSDKIEGEWTPSVTGAIANGEFTLWNLLKEDSMSDGVIQLEPIPGTKDSILVVKYLKEDIYRQENLSEIFNLPLENVPFQLSGIELPENDLLSDFTVPEGGLALSEISVGTPLEGIPTGTVLTALMFSGKLDVKLPRLPECDYKVTVVFSNLYENTNNGEPYKKEYIVEKGNDVFIETMVLTDALVKLAVDQKVEVSVKDGLLLAGGKITPGTKMEDITVELSDLKFTKAEGKIGIDPMLVEGSFDMDVDFLNELGGSFQFTEPQLNLIVKNKGIGIATGLKLSLWVNEGVGKDKFNGGELILAGNGKNDNFIAEAKGYDKNSPGLVDFLSLPPKGEIHYSGTIQSVSGGNDEIWSDGAISMDAEIKIPLKLKAEKLSYCDTIKDIDIGSDISDKLVAGVIKFIVKDNKLPISLKISELQLVDKDGKNLSAVVGEKSIAAYSNETLILELSSVNVKDLGKTKDILIRVEASTAGKEISLLTSASIKFTLMVAAKAEIKDTNF